MKQPARGTDHEPQNELIDRFYDGDLDEQQSREVGALVAADPRLKARYERVALVGSLVRELEHDRQLPADFTDRVMKGVLAVQKPRRSRLLPAVALAAAGGLALAASIGMVLRGSGAGPLGSVDMSGVRAGKLETTEHLAQRGPLAPFDAAEQLREAPSVSIESVDFGPTQGAIFLVSAGVTDTMVVWTMDESQAISGGRGR